MDQDRACMGRADLQGPQHPSAVFRLAAGHHHGFLPSARLTCTSDRTCGGSPPSRCSPGSKPVPLWNAGGGHRRPVYRHADRTEISVPDGYGILLTAYVAPLFLTLAGWLPEYASARLGYILFGFQLLAGVGAALLMICSLVMFSETTDEYRFVRNVSRTALIFGLITFGSKVASGLGKVVSRLDAGVGEFPRREVRHRGRLRGGERPGAVRGRFPARSRGWPVLSCCLRFI